MKRPIPRKCGSAYAPATLPLCARAQAAVRLRLRPRDKRMNLRSKVPKPTQPSVRSSRLAIRFGLALYDREQVGVRKVRGQAAPAIGPWVLRSAEGADEASFDKPSEFCRSAS